MQPNTGSGFYIAPLPALEGVTMPSVYSLGFVPTMQEHSCLISQEYVWIPKTSNTVASRKGNGLLFFFYYFEVGEGKGSVFSI